MQGKYHTQKWLEKYGWQPGKGLGKNEQGISDFIRVSKKEDLTGVGAPKYKVMDFSHWDSIYTKAAKNIKIDTTDEGVKVGSAPKPPKEKQKVYGGAFVKSTTLEEEQEDAAARSHVKEDELWKVCGGRELSQVPRKFRSDGKTRRLMEQDMGAKPKFLKDMTLKSKFDVYDKAEALSSDDGSDNDEPPKSKTAVEIAKPVVAPEPEAATKEQTKHKEIVNGVNNSVEGDETNTVEKKKKKDKKKKEKKKSKRSREQSEDNGSHKELKSKKKKRKMAE